MGLAYIGAVLEQAGFEVEVLDLLVSKYAQEKVARAMAAYQPDVVGITSVTMNYPAASEILRYCKGLDDTVTTVIGGPHVSFRSAETLLEAPWIDVVVRREGEQTMLDIVSGRKLDEIAGIAFRDGDIRVTPDRPFIERLDELPPPARHLFPESKYRALHGHCSVITGRGCPFHCIFCVGPKMGGRKPRFRDPRLVVDEIEGLLARGYREVNIQDDLLTVNHRRLHAICDQILARRLNFGWSAFARVDTVNAELLSKMKAAGCNWISYGVESGNQRILDTVEKKITLDKVREGVRLGLEAGINILASFIIGLPGETKQTIVETERFAEELGAMYGFHILAPCPGSKVRENADGYGIEILTDDWSKYDANRAVTRTPEVGPEEVAGVLRRYRERFGLAPSELGEESGEAGVQEARSNHRSPLAWMLVEGDVIENLGPVESRGDPVDALARKLTEMLPHSYSDLRDCVGGWNAEGLLRHRVTGETVVWNWS